MKNLLQKYQKIIYINNVSIFILKIFFKIVLDDEQFFSSRLFLLNCKCINRNFDPRFQFVAITIKRLELLNINYTDFTDCV